MGGLPRWSVAGYQPIVPPGTLVDFTNSDHSFSTHDTISYTSWMITNLLAEAQSNIYNAEAAKIESQIMTMKDLLTRLEKGEEGFAAVVVKDKGKSKGKEKENLDGDGDEFVEAVKIEILEGCSVALKLRLHHVSPAPSVRLYPRPYAAFNQS